MAEWIPKYIKERQARLARTVVTAQDWNNIFNLHVEQGDWNTEAIEDLMETRFANQVTLEDHENRIGNLEGQWYRYQDKLVTDFPTRINNSLTVTGGVDSNNILPESGDTGTVGSQGRPYDEGHINKVYTKEFYLNGRLIDFDNIVTQWNEPDENTLQTNKDVSVDANLLLTDNDEVNGSSRVGLGANSSTKKFNIIGSAGIDQFVFNKPLVPLSDGTRDIGASDVAWNHGYFKGTVKAGYGIFNRDVTADMYILSKDGKDARFMRESDSVYYHSWGDPHKFSDTVIPEIDSSFDLGSEDLKWKTVHADALSIAGEEIDFTKQWTEPNATTYQADKTVRVDRGLVAKPATDGSGQYGIIVSDSTGSSTLLMRAQGNGAYIYASSATTGLWFNKTLLNTSNKAFDIGSLNYQWRNMYLVELYRDGVPLAATLSGKADLDENGMVPISQLPGYLHNVREFATYADLPNPGEASVIYVTLDDRKTYMWGGTEYVPLSAGLVLGETSETAFRGDHGKAAYDHSQIVTGNPHNLIASDIPDLQTAIDSAKQWDESREHYLTYNENIQVANYHTGPYGRVYFNNTSAINGNIYQADSVLRYITTSDAHEFNKPITSSKAVLDSLSVGGVDIDFSALGKQWDDSEANVLKTGKTVRTTDRLQAWDNSNNARRLNIYQATNAVYVSTGSHAFASDVIPTSNNLASIGSTAFKWKDVIADQITGVYQGAYGIARQLSTYRPWVQDQAAIKTSYQNQILLHPIDKITVEISDDDVTYTEYTVTDAQKRAIVSGLGSGGGNIQWPKGKYLRVTLDARDYSTIAELVVHMSGQGATQSYKLEAYNLGTSSWSVRFPYTNNTNGWPITQSVQFAGIAMHPTGTGTSQFSRIRLTIATTTEQSDTYPNSTLYGIELLGGYTNSGLKLRDVYSWDTSGNFVLPNLLLPSANATQNIGATNQRWNSGFFSASIGVGDFTGSGTAMYMTNGGFRPRQDNTGVLGTPSQRFANAYIANDVSANTLTLDGQTFTKADISGGGGGSTLVSVSVEDGILYAIYADGAANTLELDEDGILYYNIAD